MSGTPEQARLEALVADLRKVPAFVDQPQADLEWFVAQSEELRVEVGGIIVKEDTPADKMLVMFEGEMRARREQGSQDGPVYTVRAGEVTGVLPFSRMKVFGVTGRAVLPIRALAFPVSEFPELFQRMPELSQRLDGKVLETRSEEHTSELQSPCNLVCRLLLEKKKKTKKIKMRPVRHQNSSHSDLVASSVFGISSLIV